MTAQQCVQRIAAKRGHMKTTVLAVLLVMISPGISQADDFSSLLDARKFTDQIIELFQKEKIAEAYELMKPEENTLSHRTSLFVQLDFHQLAPLSADVEY